ncbi:MAG: ribbon-helix-helix domain-containing protein [Archaeoglobaceae archaeon]
MVQQKEVEKGDKLKISISISKYLKNKMDELVERGEFASVSEIISLAITKFLTEYEIERQSKLINTNRGPIIKREIEID